MERTKEASSLGWGGVVSLIAVSIKRVSRVGTTLGAPRALSLGCSEEGPARSRSSVGLHALQKGLLASEVRTTVGSRAPYEGRSACSV